METRKIAKGFYWDRDKLVYCKGRTTNPRGDILLTNISVTGIRGDYHGNAGNLTPFNPEKDFDRVRESITPLVKKRLESLTNTKN